MQTLIKVDFRTKKIIRDREEHYIMMKGSIHQEDIANLNVYEPNNRAAKYVELKLIKLKELNKSKIIVRRFQSLSLSLLSLQMLEPLRKSIQTYKTFQTKTKYTFSSNVHGTYNQDRSHPTNKQI